MSGLSILASFVLFSLLMPFGRQISFEGIALNLRTFHLMVLVVLVAQCVPRLRIKASPFLGFLVFPLVLLLSHFLNLTGMTELVKASANIVCYVFLASWLWSVRDQLKFQQIIQGVLSLAVVLCGVAILLYGVAFVMGPSWEHFSDIVVIDRYQYRLRFPFNDPNFLAYYLIVFFWCAFFLVGRTKQNLWIFVPLALASFLTLSNSFFISLVLPLCVISKIFRNRRFWWGIGGVVAIFAVLAPFSKAIYKVGEVFVTKFTYGSGRLELWIEAVRLIFKSPFGYGWGRSPEVYQTALGISQEAHNTALDFGISLGLFGLILYCCLWGHLLLVAWRDVKLGFKFYPSLVLSVFLMQMTISTYFSSLIFVLFLFRWCWRLDYEKIEKPS